MKKWFIGAVLPVVVLGTFAEAIAQAKLEPVFKDNTYQLTGVAVSKSGRIFINYPYWSDTYKYALVEVMKDGSVKPYPDAAWNSWKMGGATPGQDLTNRWVCVQSEYVDAKDRLWVIDPASPKQAGVYRDAHKLVCFDLATNKVIRQYSFKNIVGPDSYLNDIRVDTQREVVYVTESKNGGIAVIDINSGKITMKLQGHKSVKSDPLFKFVIDGRELRDDKGPVKFNSDGLALTPDGEMLYYKPLTDNRLYRISTTALRDASLSDAELKAKVEDMGNYTTTDGMIIDEAGNLYLGDIQGYEVYSLQTSGNPKPPLKRTSLVKDMTLLQWPDSYAVHDGYLYVTTSQIDHMAKNNGGKDTRKRPYEVFRVKISR
ncbi:L-dopachrome tautomerase-related protein [Fibrella arboris]|uniref:L-dopachrome tautomerase-related protein n=1 Tax=Fibrella arboris TaxID=3242486 RepID=UPI003520686A